jgi:hypothetical protein
MGKYLRTFPDGTINFWSDAVDDGYFVYAENVTPSQHFLAQNHDFQNQAKLKFIELCMSFPYGCARDDGDRVTKTADNIEGQKAYYAWLDIVLSAATEEEYDKVLENKYQELLKKHGG